MHFSTSAALAAMAVFAGQTLAECTGLVVMMPNPRLCSNYQGPNSWICPDTGAIVGRSGDKWLVWAKGKAANVSVFCAENRKEANGLSCDANDLGSFSLDCPSQNFIVTSESLG
ncbi:hypothetical protein E4U43_006321 [Claviceps pusilla]|uniref:Cyanovirin-N domain-containing protein n=1 Tax=Claviceps pusilla TaxID=123648 RepID=A0A9P7NDT7_9HYPO|nr:hypothetical protein E4U43_006321 [Claviceps pusilla]